MLTHARFADSPAIGRGNNFEKLLNDQRGFPREFGQPDIGAVEFNDTVFADGFDDRLTFQVAAPGPDYHAGPGGALAADRNGSHR